MAKLNLDLTEIELNELSTASFQEQDEKQETKKLAADQKVPILPTKERQCFCLVKSWIF